MTLSLNHLGLAPEQPESAGTFDDVQEYGRSTPPLQPGRYRFKLPTLTSDMLEKIEQVEEPTKDGGTRTIDRIRVVFGDDHPLTITLCPAGTPDRTGEAFTWRTDNVRRRGRKDPARIISSMDFLLKGLGEEGPLPATNQEYVTKLEKYSGKEISAEVEISYYSNPNRNIYGYVQTADGLPQEAQEIEGVPGNGQRYYQSHAEQSKVDGLFPESLPVEIQGPSQQDPTQTITYIAMVRGWNDLRRFKLVEEQS